MTDNARLCAAILTSPAGQSRSFELSARMIYVDVLVKFIIRLEFDMSETARMP